MRLLLLIIIVIIPLSADAQSLDCDEMKEGTFIGELTEPFKLKWRIDRTKNTQVETPLEVPNAVLEMGYPMDPQFQIIEWIDDCSFRLKYDESKMKLDENKRILNENDGTVITVNSIEGNCYFYTSKSLINGQELTLNGKFCKE